jgi:hypothetical protein
VSHQRFAAPFFILVAAFTILGGLAPQVPAFASCGTISSFEASKKRELIRVEPSRNFKGADDPLKVVVVLLKEYLSRAKSPKTKTQIRVDLVSEGGASYRITALLGEKRFDAPLSFPDGLNEALPGLTERLSSELGATIKTKKLAPFLNESRSSAAYLRYADGVLALEGKDAVAPEDVNRAAAAFEEAIKADYNYVPAYAGLGKALAAGAVFEDSAEKAKALRAKARAEMEKAKLLNPYRAKNREEGMNWYLKAQCPENQ